MLCSVLVVLCKAGELFCICSDFILFFLTENAHVMLVLKFSQCFQNIFVSILCVAFLSPVDSFIARVLI